MLTRLYVDNYKSLVDFEFRPPELCVLIGENGSGKSTMGSVLDAIGTLLFERASAAEAFPTSTLCRWATKDVQVVEIEHCVAGTVFIYRLEMLHERAAKKVSIASETLSVDGTRVYQFISGRVIVGAQVPQAPGGVGEVMFEPTLSFLAHLDDKTEKEVLRGFRELMRKQIALKPDPARMRALSEREDVGLFHDGSNFSSWFRWLTQVRPELMGEYFASMRLALPGFWNLFLQTVGPDSKELRATFQTPSGPINLSFDELSDGQRQLCFLYLIVSAFNVGRVVFLDEPDNFISIREVQPWLAELERVLQEREGQAIIVSHGTEAMNYLGSRQAFVVTRPDGGATRIAAHDGSDGSMPSEVVLYGGGTEASASK